MSHDKYSEFRKGIKSHLFRNEETRHSPSSGTIIKPTVVTNDAATIEGRRVLRFEEARGYFTGNGKQFCVIKGSKAKGYVQPSFKTNGNGKYVRERDSLIEQGILSRTHEWEDFVFTKDYTFSAASPAACIVAGRSEHKGEWVP
ncbi:MAG: DUF4357 domain-containing protein [Pirellulaceae bacterium]